MKPNNIRKYLSLALKIVVIFFAVAGTFLSMNAGQATFMGGTRVLMYFTIQSNIAIALICGIGMYYLLSKKEIPNWWYTVKFVGTMAITLTGAVFCFVLAPTMGHLAWGMVNVFTHVIVPIAAILDFFVVGIDADIKNKKVFYTIIPPIMYLIYASIGYICKWEFADGINYPYFFLNWGSPAGAFGFSSELPFMGCMWWIFLLFILIILVGLAYLRILDMLKKKVKE